MTIHDRIRAWVLVGAGIIIGGGAVWYGMHSANSGLPSAGVVRSSAHKPQLLQRRVLYWANPMNPAIHADHAMKDNMGMAYIPVYATAPHSHQEARTGLAIDPRLAQNLGVRLVQVQYRRMGHIIHTVGTLTVDDNRVYAINPRFSGWVEHLNVRAVGDPVRRGQVLAQIYAPNLYSAEQEYLIAQEQDTGPEGAALQAAGRARLRRLGLSRAALAALRGRRSVPSEVRIIAPASGVVETLSVHQGGYISPQRNLMQIANLRRVWSNVAIYAYQLPWVRIGDPVRLHLPGYPSKVWHGTLRFLYPTLNPRSRTVTARLSFQTRRGTLKPGMYADATIVSRPRTALAVPESAVLRTAGGDYVMVGQKYGHFLPVQVALGPATGGWIAVDRGLKAGDRVVDNAQFLLYSESEFQSVKARLLGGNTGSAAHVVPRPMPSTPETELGTGDTAGMAMGAPGTHP
ncbi:MAG: efflux RND transporter periplasmic adaptor subunit [Acidiferrobacter sp.]